MKSRMLRPMGSLVSPWTLGIAASTMALLLYGSAPASAQALNLDHFMCYTVSAKAINVPVLLQDQFDQMLGIVENVNVTSPNYFCNPVKKTLPSGAVTNIIHIENHLKWYRIQTNTVPTHKLVILNQFGTQKISTGQPRWLAVPTKKDNLGAPIQLDHFKCYTASGTALNVRVTLEDQFELDRNFTVLRPLRWCNPTVKSHNGQVTPIQNPQAHLICYDVARSLTALNQFGSESLLVRKMTLCVPSQKLQVQ